MRKLATFLSFALFASLAFADVPPKQADAKAAPPAATQKPTQSKPDARPADANDAKSAGAAKAGDATRAADANALAKPDAPTTTDGARADAQGSAATSSPPKPRMANGLVSVTLAEVPDGCKETGRRAIQTNVAIALPARISLASCVSDATIGKLQLIDGTDSIVAIDNATATAFELLDDTAANGDAIVKVMAMHAKAELYSNIMSRMLKTIPSVTQATSQGQALLASRRAILESMMTPWRDKQLEAYQAVVEIATLHPELAKNAVAQAAINDSRQRVAQHGSVATR